MANGDFGGLGNFDFGSSNLGISNGSTSSNIPSSDSYTMPQLGQSAGFGNTDYGGGGGGGRGPAGSNAGGANSEGSGSKGMFGASMGVFGGIIGGMMNDEDEERAAAARKAAMDYILNVATPDDLANPIILKQFQQAGLLTPELMEKLSLNADKVNEIIENPQNRQNQQDTLNALKDMSQTGLTAADRAAFNQLRNQTAADTQAKTNQILQQQAMRGQSSGGNTLAAQLSAVQGAGQTASSEADRLAANATQARASALNNFGQMSSQVRGQDLGTQQYNMNNELTRQRFIDQNSLSRQANNVSAKNAAQQYNLGRQQGISDRNIGQDNAELYAQKQRQKDLYGLQMDKASRLSKLSAGDADYYNQSAANTAQNWSNAGQGMGQSVDAYMGTGGGGSGGGGGMGGGMMSMMSDENVKKDVKEFDVDKFLNKLNGKQFKYKEPLKHGDGLKVGVMAQDMERADPNLVHNTTEGKAIDYGKSGGHVFASLAELHKRIQNLEKKK